MNTINLQINRAELIHIKDSVETRIQRVKKMLHDVFDDVEKDKMLIACYKQEQEELEILLSKLQVIYDNTWSYAKYNGNHIIEA